MSIETKADNRVLFLDVAKAFGIYLVILGHLVLLNWRVFRFIFSFHMPLFFVVSGYVFSHKEMSSFVIFFKKLIKNYLTPYFIIFLISILQCFFIPMEGYGLLYLSSDLFIRDLYEGQFRFSYFGVSWFLICMFWAQLFIFVLLKIKHRTKKYIYILIWILFVVMAIYTPELCKGKLPYGHLPLKIDSALMATVFMGVGYGIAGVFRKIGIESNAKLKKIIGLCLLIIGIPIVYFVSCKGNYYVNLCEAIYAIPERYLVGAIFGSLMIIGLGLIFEDIKILQMLGQNTLIIFLSHSAVSCIVIELINYFFGIKLKMQDMFCDWKCIAISFIVLLISFAISYLFLFFKKNGKRIYSN